jgi:heme O synthase-like polyprenyltransferase
VPATLVVEGTLFAAGVLLYATGTRPRNRTGRIAFWALVVVLAALYVANLGATPPSAAAVAVSGLLMWLLIAWGAWIDRNREPVPEATVASSP